MTVLLQGPEIENISKEIEEKILNGDMDRDDAYEAMAVHLNVITTSDTILTHRETEELDRSLKILKDKVFECVTVTAGVCFFSFCVIMTIALCKELVCSL